MSYNITEHIEAAFKFAESKNPDLRKNWVSVLLNLSNTVNSKFSHLLSTRLSSFISYSINDIANLDILLRGVERERLTMIEVGDQSFSTHYQLLFSELWVCKTYEVLRVLKCRKIAQKNSEFFALFRDVELIRIALDKGEIAKDRRLINVHKTFDIKTENLRFTDEYDKSDPARAFIPSYRLSNRGSQEWRLFDVINKRFCELERLDISERVIHLWADQVTAS